MDGESRLKRAKSVTEGFDVAQTTSTIVAEENNEDAVGSLGISARVEPSPKKKKLKPVKKLEWSPEEIFNEMHGLPIAKEMRGVTVLFEVGGVERGWKIDCSSSGIDDVTVISRYDVSGRKYIAEDTSLPWCRYKDRKVFSKIESGKLNDMVAYATGRIQVKGDSTKFDKMENIWAEAKERANDRKNQVKDIGIIEKMENGEVSVEEVERVDYVDGMDAKLDEEDDNDDREDEEEEEDEEEAIDEEAFIITTYKPEVEPRDPRTKAFWKRHMGTDSLVGSYLFLLSSVGYLSMTIYSLHQKSNTATSVQFALQLANVFSAVLFTLSSLYFIKLSYPEIIMLMIYRSAAIDPETMTFLERYFTANDMLIALWLATAALGLPYLSLVLYECLVLGEWVNGLIVFLTTILGVALSGVMSATAMPDCMRANNGKGTRVVFEKCVVPLLGLKNDSDRFTFYSKHLGNDGLVVAWTLGILGTLCGIPVTILVILHPRSISMWLIFWSTMPFSVGSLLFVRASYPETMNSSIFFSDEENDVSHGIDEGTPLL
eukprot:CAMPEP_0194379628 /NCGR_PEP_ID=MMETSP0174-20130528/40173_1 /TAXON_ID=216777 /ORGANISM="Proboscia alata, Strain PI-D3" /LENGTH=544 /DNA_ID=CAMNT_0039162461 /DNA_START=152 /DNA_END=1787 /DNA_ORIENTATION=+